jgi:hypothetical protein
MKRLPSYNEIRGRKPRRSKNFKTRRTLKALGRRRDEGIKNINPKDMIGVTKTPLHLVSPIAIVFASIAKFLGNVKYGAWNYRGSETSASVYYGALMRHLFHWWSGEENDPQDGTPHLANAMACLEILIEGMYIGNMHDDRPPRVSLRSAMKMVEDLMPVLVEKYRTRDPKHWTIADPVATPIKEKRRAKAKA